MLDASSMPRFNYWMREPFETRRSLLGLDPHQHTGVATAVMREKSGEAKFDDVEIIDYDQSAGWSSLVARWAHNPKVGGSNPPPATKPLRNSFL